MPGKLIQRFQELQSQMDQLEAGKKREYNPLTHATHIDIAATDLLNWQVKVENLLAKACGENSSHLTAFRLAGMPGEFTTNLQRFERMRAAFLAAKEDFEGGYLSSLRALVQAEVFSTQLEQASNLAGGGSGGAAAIVAGAVLETVLRELCTRDEQPRGSLEEMNASLGKAGTYDLLQQKRIAALGQIREHAIRGRAGEFTDEDVRSMIAEIDRFLSEHLR